MNLHVAQSLLLQDRADWNKPHLSWLPSKLYRSYFATKRKA